MKRKHFFAGLMAAAMVIVGVPAGIGSITAEAASTIASPDVTVTAPAEGQAPAGAVLNSTVVSSSELTSQDVVISSDGGINGKLTAKDNTVLNIKGNTKLLMHFEMKTGKVDKIESIMGKMNSQYGVQMASIDSSGNAITPSLIFYARFEDKNNKEQWAQVTYTIPGDSWYNTWHDVTAYYDGNELNLYVDGTEATEKRDVTGALREDADSTFTIGYNKNPLPADQADPKGTKQKFMGELRNVGLYVGDNVPNVTWAGKTPTEIKAALANNTSDFTLKTSAQESDCKVKSTTWEPNDSKFGRYGDYKVTVVLEAGTGNSFKSTDATLRTAQGVLSGARATLNSSKTEMTITYTFEGEENPKAALQEYMNSAAVKAIGTENKDAAGVRKYTKDTWNTYAEAYNNAVAVLEKAEEQQAEVYTGAKRTLEDAVNGLLSASDHCECVLSEITGFEGSTFELYESEEMKVELGSGTFTYSDDCVMHAGSKPQASYELIDNPEGAVLEGNVLKLTADASSVQVRLTVTMGEQTKTATATYTVKKKDANELRKDLVTLMNEIAGLNVADYTADSWNAMKTVYDEARKISSSTASAADYVKVYKALTAAKNALVKNSSAAPAKPVAGQKVDTSDGRYEVISAEKKTVRLVKAKAKKSAKMGVAGSISINGVKYTVTEVGAKAFKGIKTLKQITLSKSIQTIGKQAFSGCKKLSKVVVKSTVLKNIKSGAFKGTSKKMTVTFKSKKVKAKTRKALLKKMQKAGMSKSAKLK